MARWFVKDGKGQGSTHANEAAARGMYNSAAAQLQPGEKASMHLCSHKDGESPSAWYDCRRTPTAQYEETVKPGGPPP